MKARHWIQIHILDTLENAGDMHLDEIFASQPDVKKSTRDYHIKQLTNRGEIERVQNGIYRKPASTDTQTQLHAARKKFSSNARSAAHNKETIDALLNTYDEVLVIFQVWVLESIVSQEIDFEKQLLFMENFKGLTAIGDKLMKRWSLEHVGYDTNTRQAQEDAKAKTEERQKEALKDAPLRDRIMIVGKYDPEAEKLIDCIPSSLEELDRRGDRKNHGLTDAEKTCFLL